MAHTILQIDASARRQDSISRQVTGYLAEQLLSHSDEVIHRDLASTDLPLLTQAHIQAYYTPADQRTQTQQELLHISDQLIAELKSAHQLVIGAPMYNFSVPAALKAWIDLVCRVGETFVYQEGGPQGLLDIERAFIVVSAGGTPVGSEVDFNSAYVKQVCHFIGIDEVHIIDVSGSKRDPETLVDFAREQVDRLIAS